VTTRERGPIIIRQMKYQWDSAQELAGTEQPSFDDAPITADGELLDSPSKIREFLRQINAQRTSEDDFVNATGLAKIPNMAKPDDL